MFLGEMADSKSGTRKMQDEPRTHEFTRKQGEYQRLLEVSKEFGANLKELSQRVKRGDFERQGNNNYSGSGKYNE